MAEVTINTAPLNLRPDPAWRYLEIQVDDWEQSMYQDIVDFRRDHSNPEYLLESGGRVLVMMPQEKLMAWDKDILILQTRLAEHLGRSVILRQLEKPDFSLVGEAMRMAIGGRVAMKLGKLGFTKVGSKGGVGRFSHPEHSREKDLGEVKLRHLWDFTVTLDDRSGDPKAYLSIDMKTEVDGTETLLDLVRFRKKSDQDDPIHYWPGDQKRWKVLPGPSDLKERTLFLKDLEDQADGLPRPLGLIRHGDLKDATVQDFLDAHDISLEKDEYIAVLGDRGRRSRDPNREYRLPASMLSHTIPNSSVKGRSWENDFHRFSKPSSQDRGERVSRIFSALEAQGLTGAPVTFTGLNPRISYPTARKHSSKPFGTKIRLDQTGVQEWGSMKRIHIHHQSNKGREATELEKELTAQLEIIAGKSGVSPPEIFTNQFQRTKELQSIADDRSTDPTETLHFFIGFRTQDYREVKTMFTHTNRKPVQFVQPRTLRKARQSVATMIPQIIAKTGGLPYSLQPPILDNALIIGIDKARDSSTTRPSASAGVAAVTPEGRYVSAASTPLDSTRHDRIDIDRLAPDLLRNLEDNDATKNLDYVVIPRDGSPETCRSEVEAWQRHLTNDPTTNHPTTDLPMVFLASRKQNPYRAFPTQGKKYDLPVILNGSPLPKDDFLIITTNPFQGTAQPVLYTLMANTTSLTREQIQDSIIAQVVSMSMLCWESPMPTSQPLPLHYADKLANFTQLTQQAWVSSNRHPMFI